MSEISRLTGVLFDPKPAFADIAARPRWVAPLLLVIAVSLCFTIAIGQRIGWETVVRQQIESSSRTQNLPPEQRDRAIQQGARVAGIVAYAGPVVGVPVMSLLIALVLLGAFKVAGASALSFAQSFATACYACMVHVVSGALSIVVLYLKRAEDFNINNPLAFNVGAFLEPTSSAKWLYSLGSSLDLFSIWIVLLLATGMAATDRKMGWPKAFGIVATLWLALVLLKCGWAALMG